VAGTGVAEAGVAVTATAASAATPRAMRRLRSNARPVVGRDVVVLGVAMARRLSVLPRAAYQVS
jgi:hypothetical protein